MTLEVFLPLLNDGTFMSYNIIFHIVGFRVEEETRSPISTPETKAKKAMRLQNGYKMRFKEKKSQKVLFCLVYLQNENQYALTINAILSRINCNIRSSKNMRNLGYEGIMRKRSSSGTCIITKYIYTFCFLLYLLDLWLYKISEVQLLKNTFLAEILVRSFAH